MCSVPTVFSPHKRTSKCIFWCLKTQTNQLFYPKLLKVLNNCDIWQFLFVCLHELRYHGYDPLLYVNIISCFQKLGYAMYYHSFEETDSATWRTLKEYRRLLHVHTLCWILTCLLPAKGSASAKWHGSKKKTKNKKTKTILLLKCQKNWVLSFSNATVKCCWRFWWEKAQKSPT